MNAPMIESFEAFRSRVAELKVSELLGLDPRAEGVLYNHVGASCFECPARETETVRFALEIHESLVEQFYRDLYEALTGYPAREKTEEETTE